MKDITSTSNILKKSNFKNSVINSLPSKNGLWIPNKIKKLTNDFFKNIVNLNFIEIAEIVLSNLINFEPELNKIKLKNILTDSYNFPIELKKLKNRLYVLETFHGPTLTFKDFGARFLANYLKEILDKKKKYIVLVSTSGDTGSAIASAFKNISNIDVIILYPNNRVSKFQEKQLTTNYNNIIAFSLDGSFDKCQNFAKKAFVDKDLNSFNLISANSINIARLIPQTLYYFYTYSLLKKQFGNKVDNNLIFSVPCGNCGNLTGGILAKKMGLPIKFISSQNTNNTFNNFLRTGFYFKKKSEKTLSNAMDVGNPSNFKRLKFLYSLNKLKNIIFPSDCNNNHKIKQCIKEVYDKYKYIIEPHTAVAYNGYLNYSRKNQHKNEFVVLVSTAHPYKFKSTILNNINDKLQINLPFHLKNLNNLKNEKIIVKNNYNILKKLILNKSNSSLNITFIGMPGSGKSSLSKSICKKYNLNLIELDELIEKKHNKSLFKLIEINGDSGFKKIEEDTILDIKFQTNKKNIISTGGSVIYSEKGMEHLKHKNNIIVYLQTDLEILMKRTENFTNRGIVFNNLTPKELYDERNILYEKYCDIKIDTSYLSIDFLTNIFRYFYNN